MKLALFILFGFLVGCQVKDIPQSGSIVVDSADKLEQYVGQYITLKGVVTNTKIPQIHGVDVSCEDFDARGEMAVASGILLKTSVKPEDIDIYSQNRGAGTYYRLTEKGTNFDAKVKKP